jgi:integrase
VWLPAKRHSVKPTTYAGYERELHVYVVPAIGREKLRDLDGAALSVLDASLLEGGRRQGDGGLAPKSVRNIAGMLHKAFADAVRWRILAFNPAAAAEVPRPAQPEMVVWTAAQLATFIESTRGDRFAAMWRLAATTGMRRGELCGLRWKDVDLKAGRIRIVNTRTVVNYKIAEGTPKTRAGARTNELDAMTVASLRRWQRVQKSERLRVGAGWTDTGLVFTCPAGTGVLPQWVRREFERLARLAGLPRIRLHDLRHTYVTVAIGEARQPVKVVSQRVGHSNVTTTLSLYAHVLPGDDEAAAEAVAPPVDRKW